MLAWQTALEQKSAMRNLRLRLNTPSRVFMALGVVLVMVGLLVSAQAQYRSRRAGRFRGGYESNPRTQEQEMMQKAIDPAFSEDVFTFARLKFSAEERGWGWGRTWDDDTPNADLMLTFRLFQVTSLKVRPGLNFIDITTKDLADYPFVYLSAAGQAVFTEDEAAALRAYLLNGGFLMADDFWGDDEWEHFVGQVKLIFPNRTIEPMDLKHPIFHTVYDFKKQPQIPSVGDFFSSGRSYDIRHRYEQWNHDPHYYGIYDDKHRLMMLICHNNHYGDGWEHEGDDETYFHIFSEQMGYPMFINVLVYTMSH
jgi:hypothetical protein